METISIPSSVSVAGESNPKKKSPGIFKILGILSIIAGCLNVLATLGIFFFVYLFFSGENISLVTQLYAWGVILLYVAMSILAFVQGVGFLKLKRWMPKLVIVLFAVVVLAQLFQFGLSPESFLDKGWERALEIILIDGVIVWTTYKNRALFVA